MNEMIKRRKRFTEPEAAFFMSQLLDALQYIHDQNVIHRDLKLGNLFLDKQLNIKVGDLGLATRLEDKEEKRKTICGTPNYIAPEVIQNDKAKRGHSFEVDVWSMGVILFTVLVGKPPYEAKDVKGTYQRILANEYCFPEHVTVSEDAKDLIMSMLKTDPKERYVSIRNNLLLDSSRHAFSHRLLLPSCFFSPSLDAITRHSFLSDLSRPEYLPHSCLHTAPVWCRTEFGQLVTQEDLNVVKPKKSMISRGSTRLPFAHHDANLVHQKSSSVVKDTVEIRSVVNQRTPTAFPTPPGNPSTFKIFDEAANRNHTASTRSVTSVGSTENLMARTKALTLSTGKKAAERLRAERSVAKSPVNLDHQEESQFLYTQLERLGDVLQITESRKGQYRPLTPTSMRNGSLPEAWVVRYVDYTSKYGLGFLLSNGSSGVFFNDSTKIALDQDGYSFQYVERKRTDASAVGRVDVLSGSHSLSTYPENLNKKVTLLKHFRNYLMEQQKKEGEDTSVTGVQGASSEFGKQDQVYVKKWLRTKHAILFWLSINVLQVVFFDQTEVILTEDDSSIVYVDKMQRRQSFDFTDEVVGSFPELEKRVKYSRDILKQLLNGQRL
jgi:serine/threonine protein kinase